MCLFFFFKQKTAYEMRISDWSSDVCSSDLKFPGYRAADLEAEAIAMTRSISWLRRLGRSERGAAMIEFALTAPLFLLVLMGAFDYCWQMYAQQVLQGAVSKAGRDSTLEADARHQSALDTLVREQGQQVFAHAEVKFKLGRPSCRGRVCEDG